MRRARSISLVPVPEPMLIGGSTTSDAVETGSNAVFELNGKFFCMYMFIVSDALTVYSSV